ncbi:MAG TPA: hypothetical protein VEZ24_12265 [Microvirga sp.]|nr:hypothetical protein [Microvirga sp.]
MLIVGALLALTFVIGVLLTLKGIRKGADAEKMKKANVYWQNSFYIQFGGALAVFSFAMVAAWMAGL